MYFDEYVQLWGNLLGHWAVLRENSHFWMVFLEDFEQRNKGQAYAEFCKVQPPSDQKDFPITVIQIPT